MPADPEDIVVEDVQIVEELDDADTYHDSKSISSIATIANVMAWVILVISVIGVVVFGVVVYDARATIATPNGIFSVISALVPFFTGFFFFVALKALAEGLYVMIDIEANTRRPVSR
jgi:hypothetical protein